MNDRYRRYTVTCRCTVNYRFGPGQQLSGPSTGALHTFDILQNFSHFGKQMGIMGLHFGCGCRGLIWGYHGCCSFKCMTCMLD